VKPITLFRNRTWLSLAAAVAVAVLVACSKPAPVAAEAFVPADQVRSWQEYVAALATDGLGSYEAVASQVVDGPGGFKLGIEARYYPELAVTRFVILHDSLEVATERAGGIVGMKLKVDSSGEPVPLYIRALSGEDLEAELLTATETFPDRHFSDAADDLVCGSLKVDFGSAKWFPFELRACNRYVAG